MSGLLHCPGDLIVQSGASPVCSVDWVLVPYIQPFDPSQLDPVTLGQAFGAGFTLVGSFLVMSIGIRAFLNFIKQS